MNSQIDAHSKTRVYRRSFHRTLQDTGMPPGACRQHSQRRTQSTRLKPPQAGACCPPHPKGHPSQDTQDTRSHSRAPVPGRASPGPCCGSRRGGSAGRAERGGPAPGRNTSV